MKIGDKIKRVMKFFLQLPPPSLIFPSITTSITNIVRSSDEIKVVINKKKRC